MNVTHKYILVLLGTILGLVIIGIATAHPPCDDYTQPRCQYVQVVNPYTGKLETQYVCH